MADWTRAPVEDRLETAADVMRSLPAVKPQGYVSAWPEFVRSFGDQVGQEPTMKRPRPSPRAIAEAEEAMLWLRWLEVDDARLVWARAEKTPWKHVCWRFGISRATAHRRWEYALSVIVWRLNGRQPHLRRGRAYVVEQAR